MDAAKKTEKKVVKKVYKIRLRVYPDGTSMIMRNELPSLIDKTENSINWLGANGFKPDEIELLGEKPPIWDTVYPSTAPAPVIEQPAVEPEVAPVSVEPVVDPIVQGLDLPVAEEVTVLKEVFVPVAEAVTTPATEVAPEAPPNQE